MVDNKREKRSGETTNQDNHLIINGGASDSVIDFSLTDAHPKFKLDISNYKSVSNEKDMNNLFN